MMLPMNIELLNGSEYRLGDIIAPSDAPSPALILMIKHYG